MHIRIRADIFNAAIHFAALTGNDSLTYRPMFPNPENDGLTYNTLKQAVPQLGTEFAYFVSQWDGDRDPAAAFFSIDPPGTWLRLREAIGPDAMDLADLNEQLDSEEALGAVLQHFLPALEQQMDERDKRRERAGVG